MLAMDVRKYALVERASQVVFAIKKDGILAFSVARKRSSVIGCHSNIPRRMDDCPECLQNTQICLTPDVDIGYR